MRKIHNIALICMLIGVLVCQDLAYAFNLRVPMGDHARIEEGFQYTSEKEDRYDLNRISVSDLEQTSLIDRPIYHLIKSIKSGLTFLDSHLRRNAAETLGILKDRGLGGSIVIEENIVSTLISDLINPDVHIRTSSLDALEILKEKGLIRDIVIGEHIVSSIIHEFNYGEDFEHAMATHMLGTLVTKDFIRDINTKKEIVSILKNRLIEKRGKINTIIANILVDFRDIGLVEDSFIVNKMVPYLVKTLKIADIIVLAEYSADILGKVKDKGLIQDAIVGERILSRYIEGLIDEYEFMRYGSAKILGILIDKDLVSNNLVKKHIKKIVTRLKKGLTDEYKIMHRKSAETLAILKNKGFGEYISIEDKIVSELKKDIVSFDKSGRFPEPEDTLGILVKSDLVERRVIEKHIKDIVSGLVTGLTDTDINGYVAISSAKRLAILKDKGFIKNNVIRNEDIGHMVSRLKSRLKFSNEPLFSSSSKVLEILINKDFITNTNVIKDIVSMFLEDDFKYTNRDVCIASARVLSMLKYKDLIKIVPGKAIVYFYNNPSRLKPYNKNAKKISLILKIVLFTKGDTISNDCFIKLEKMINGLVKTRKDYFDKLEILLGTMAFLSNHKSDRAQEFLERRIGDICKRRKGKDKFIELTREDILYIDTTLESYRQISLLEFVHRDKFSPDIRVHIITQLARLGLIDSGYDESFFEDRRDEKIAIISDAYQSLRIIPPFELLQTLEDKKTSLRSIKKFLKNVNRVLSANDLRKTLRALSKNSNLLLAYYCFYQAPFHYPGTSTMSYERFEKFIKKANLLLKEVDNNVLNKSFRKALKKVGLEDLAIDQIIDNLQRGGPPLADDSKYLDEKGRFIPQYIGIDLVIKGTRIEEALYRFNNTKEKLSLLLKIDFLIKEITRALKKVEVNDSVNRKTFSGIMESLDTKVINWDDLESTFHELVQLFNDIFTEQRVPLDERLALYQKKKTRQLLKDHNYMFFLKSKDNIEELGLSNLDITGLDKRSTSAIKILEKRRRDNRLSDVQKEILGDREIKIDHLINLFFHSLSSILDDVFLEYLNELTSDMKTDYETYILSLDGREMHIPSVYLDYVDKRNLFEILRFSDGAHCCNSSDPKISGSFAETSLYEDNASRWIVDATTIFFQLSTEPSGGKQIGWLKAWFGIDKKGKPFVGSNYLYLNPTYKDPRLRNAILAHIGEILSSIHMDKYAQASCSSIPQNAITPPETYKSTIMKNFIRLQSLRDGEPIQADVKFSPNKTIKAEFYIKELTPPEKEKGRGGSLLLLESVEKLSSNL